MLLNGASALLLGGFTLACFQLLDDARLVDQAQPPAYTPQDKASDLMLPSLFVTEAYLLCFELGAATDPATQQRLQEQLGKLRSHYEQSYQYWAQSQAQRLQPVTTLLNLSHQSAQQLNRLALGPFSDAVQQGRRAEQQQLMADLTVLFEQHRRELNEAVQAVRNAEQNGQDTLATYIKQQRFWAGVELMIASVLSVLLAHALQHRLLKPLARRLWPPAPAAAQEGAGAALEASTAFVARPTVARSAPVPGEPAPGAVAPPEGQAATALATHGAQSPGDWLEGLDLIVVGVDGEGRVLLFNRAAERFSGFQRHEALGQRWMDLSARLNPARHPTAPATQLGDGAGDTAIYELTDLRGARRRVVWRSSALQVPGQSDAAHPGLVQINIGIDLLSAPDSDLPSCAPPSPASDAPSGVAPVTPLQALDQALRGPLNTVLGMSALALRAVSEAQRQHYLQRTQLAGQRMADALEDAMDRVLIEHASLALQTRPFCLLDMLDDLLTSTVEQADEQGLQLRPLVPETVTTALVGDPARLVEVLSQLVDNSLRSQAPGDVQIQVKTLHETELTVTLQFEVIDHASGQDGGRVNALLSLPEQPQPLAPAPGEPLYTTQHLVALMQGQLWVSRGAQQERRFGFSATFGRASVPQVQRLTSSITLRPSRVLVLDADPDAGEILAQLMGAWQMSVQCCQQQGPAWKALKEARQQGQPFQTLVIQLPPDDADTLDWLVRLQDQTELSAGLNVIAVSHGHPSPRLAAAQAQGLRIGAVLSKPIRQHMLLSTLRQLPPAVPEV